MKSSKLLHFVSFDRNNLDVAIISCLVIKTDKKKDRFSWKLLCTKFKEKRRTRRDKQKQNIVRVKETAPDQNAINLTSTELSQPQKSLLQKGSSFVPTPSDINCYEVRRDFDKFVNQLSYRLTHSTDIT